MIGPRARAIAIPVLLAVLLALVPAQAGDKDLAELMMKKAVSAFRAKNYEKAADLYRRARDEAPPHPEAAHGLAQCLEKLGDVPGALAAYLEARDAIAAMDSPSRTLTRMVKNANKAIARLGEDYAELQTLDEEYGKKFYDLGRKHQKASPGWAKRAFLATRFLDPAHDKVGKSLAALGDVAAAVPSAGRFDSILESDGMKTP